MSGIGDWLSGRIDNVRAHPFQSGASALAGGFLPGGGLIANQIFNRYNQGQFNNSAQTGYDRSLDQTTMDANSAMNAPLSDPRLNQFDNMGSDGQPSGDQTPVDRGGGNQDNSRLAQALTGQGGGAAGQNFSGPSNWNPQSYSGWNPNQANASQNFGLLDFLGPNPNGQSGPMNHQEHVDSLAQGNGGGMPSNYGVSNFNVGGSPVIFGTQGNDMNGMAMFNPRRYGG
jgi:hypothetical protein